MVENKKKDLFPREDLPKLTEDIENEYPREYYYPWNALSNSHKRREIFNIRVSTKIVHDNIHTLFIIHVYSSITCYELYIDVDYLRFQIACPMSINNICVSFLNVIDQ